ncbi:molybdate ABC transporter substrate-binding protein [Niallia sp. Sow4_A1]|jgi:molybdate transport system substrate-binding protein|uniref:Molybdate ABC transporter substrate-binding protein n=1 Tax=Niallia hominis TaxID=3133173 RepID=A0ABV1F9D8_9BACI|nr:MULTISPECIES: molybdate ABC transporter substrate-binding protein [Bacillaceae]MCM3361429.1 molybdate ABC transporter substrate-binding protein [Niallia sp. MER TA 168]CAI9395843.1 Molybdate-binding protein ModA [Bacillus sp. T2.9-1]
MKKYSKFLLLLALLILASCSNNGENTSSSKKETFSLTISAAASMQDSLNTIKKKFEEEHPDITLTFNFGSSGALQQQIAQGAPVDLFFSAAQDKLDLLVDDGLIKESDHIDLVKNNLVLITNKQSNVTINRFADLETLDKEKIAIGIPESVPAGNYAKETLQTLHIWEKVQENIITAKDVRQVLSYVETNNVAAGIVYGTDAKTSDSVEVVATAEESSHSPIVYPIGIIKDSKNYEAAKTFYDYLQTPTSLKVFEEDGFIVN